MYKYEIYTIIYSGVEKTRKGKGGRSNSDSQQIPEKHRKMPLHIVTNTGS